jgi:hypothetical protein
MHVFALSKYPLSPQHQIGSVRSSILTIELAQEKAPEKKSKKVAREQTEKIIDTLHGYVTETTKAYTNYKSLM